MSSKQRDGGKDGTTFTRREVLGGALSGAAFTGRERSPASVAGSRWRRRAPRRPPAPGSVRPGDLDEYYGFWSSGQTGEVRIMGLRRCGS